jgi:HPt (histidine-containing phosphotransfer) domain-containing protein
MQDAAAFDEAAALEAAAHKLKGSASNFGARRLKRLCLVIEELAREDLARFARLLLPELERELSAVIDLLEQEV